MELCDSLKQAEFICDTGQRSRNFFWEQPEQSPEHRRIPDEPILKLESLSHSPHNLIVDGSFFSF